MPGPLAVTSHNHEMGIDVLTRALRFDLFAPHSVHQLGDLDLGRTTGLWMGFGLCSARGMSKGLPADALVMLTAAEHLRRALSLRHTTVLVADSNALAVGHARSEVRDATLRLEETLGNLKDQLDWPLRTVRGSDIAPWPRVARAQGHHQDQPYVHHQVVQMEAMAAAGDRIKLGWFMSASDRDEAFFDRLYRDHQVESMGFVYTVCGRALDHRRPRACPYITTEHHTRVMLNPDEHIDRKLDLPNGHPAHREASGYRKLLRKIGRGIARLRNERAPRQAETLLQRLLTGDTRGIG